MLLMKKLRYGVAFGMLGTAALLGGCAADISPMSYSDSQAQEAAATYQGVVIAASPVKVSSQGSGLGTLAGAAAGAVGGSAIGGGWRANTLGGIGGALVGGAIGNYAEKKLSTQTGMQYEVKLRTGRIVSVTQGMDPVFAVGQHVFVILGDKARIIADMSRGR